MNFAILAAGEGSRLVSEGVPTPKPLVEIDGRPMIGRLIDIFISCGAESISVITNNEMTQVSDYIKSLDLPVDLRLTVKSTPSSMHSFHEVSRLLPQGKFIATTVDTIFLPEPFKKYADAFGADSNADGYMAVTPYIEDEKPLYIQVNSDMDITAFLDTPPIDAKYISGGIYGLTPPALDILQHCMDNGISRMRNYQRELISAGLRLKAWEIEKIIDVDHQTDIQRARQFISTGNL